MKKKYKDVYYDVPDVKTIKELVIHGVGEGKDQPLFMYDYEGDDGTACAVSFYMRLDGTEWNEELEELPPRYEEYKAALANK